jgi:hypothetical protein
MCKGNYISARKLPKCVLNVPDIKLSSQDSAVGIATGYGLDGRGVGQDLSPPHVVQTGSGAHPAS